MKNKFYILIFSLFLVLNSSQQVVLAESSVVESIASVFSSNSNANSLANYLAPSVEISIIDKEANYSKSQAIVIINTFFQTHSISSFKLKHQGNSPNGSVFGIGSLVTTNGNFNVVFYLKNNLIQELRIEKE